ncbi:26S protease regulatory subunit 6A [Vavraia culicis subsp. floridensis]|uniref:26S proteasome regulatory subunit 6A n=1 Tax=Vavraia culicis (isolate floridensis) TaxID=948595 RepID=L2GXV0_VAVCU|nr:26S protease regulatory subunit 6A [Vavraia culicis subsp. floridensis]ELA47910.1 26S protease regulatory subunit 6A [Vavraia culicis subsp. floridensis]
MSHADIIQDLLKLRPNLFDEDLGELDVQTKLINGETDMIKSVISNIEHQIRVKKEGINENLKKIKLNRQMPYLVGNVVEILDDDENEEKKSAVVSTSTRVTSFLPMIGLVEAKDLRPGDMVSLHKETNVIFEKLPPDYDNRVKAMELDEKPTETYEDIGGLERQIMELTEALVLPITHPERFRKLNIRPPKGVLMHGPPGTGKTLMARACAARSETTFMKLAGPQLVQMYIGDGAKLVRDAFKLAVEKKPTIIFIDEIDAIGTKRTESDRTGDREVQRTMLELLNQLDGFSSSDDVKIIAATNRVDILDPALLRSGRFDRKIEFPLPNTDGRKRILQIHARKMSVSGSVNFDELARSTEGFNGAQCKAVCVEAGMAALRKDHKEITQNDMIDGIQEVMAKKKSVLMYFT